MFTITGRKHYAGERTASGNLTVSARQFALNLAATIVLLIPVSVIIHSLWHKSQQTNALLAVTHGYYRSAVKMLQDSIDTGDRFSTVHLANLYRLGLGVDVDHRSATQMYWQTAAAGNSAAMINLAQMYRFGLGVEKNPEVAYGWFNLARNYHHPAGQLYMSEMLANHELSGHLVPQLKQRYATLENMPSPD